VRRVGGEPASRRVSGQRAVLGQASDDAVVLVHPVPRAHRAARRPRCRARRPRARCRRSAAGRRRGATRCRLAQLDELHVHVVLRGSVLPKLRVRLKLRVRPRTPSSHAVAPSTAKGRRRQASSSSNRPSVRSRSLPRALQSLPAPPDNQTRAARGGERVVGRTALTACDAARMMDRSERDGTYNS